MADENKTQWTNTEYAQDNAEAQDSYELENSGAENEPAEEEYEEDYGSSSEPSEYAAPKKGPLGLILIIILLLICAGAFLLYKQMKPQENAENAGGAPLEQPAQQNDDAFFQQDDSGAAGGNNAAEQQNQNDLFNDGGGQQNNQNFENQQNQYQGQEQQNLQNNQNENAAQVQEDKLEHFGDNNSESDGSIMVAWNKTARQNPFMPPVFEETADNRYEQVGNVQFEIIEPPTKLVPDDNLTKLLQTQISGILYDGSSPSAIVNLAGVDQFVKIGDVVSGYKINNITNNKVEISYKNNTYVASVGELFTRGRLEAKPAVSNLTEKFAGRYKKRNIEE